MSTLEVTTATAPSYWATYLINGDASGMTVAELEQADAFVKWFDAYIVDGEDAGFCHQHDALQFGALPTDCQTYIALVNKV